MVEYVVDAHPLLWYLADDSRLGAKAAAATAASSSSLIIPSIALAEACWIVGKNRTKLSSARLVLQEVDADPRVAILPLARDIIERTIDMPEKLEMHDRQIIASAMWLVEQGRSIVVLTRDAEIIKSGLVEVEW